MNIAFEPHLKSINDAYLRYFLNNKKIKFTLLSKPTWKDSSKFKLIKMICFMIKAFYLFIFKYDLVHINGSNFGLVAYFASFFGVKYIFTIHGCPHPEFDRREGGKVALMNYFSEKVMNLVASRAAGIYTISNFSKKELYDNYGINTDVIYNGYDKERFSYFQDIGCLKKFYSLDEKKVFISVGRMIPCKNPYQVIDIFKKFNDKDDKTFLIFIGDGILFESVVQYAKDQEIKDVLFLKCVDFNELHKYYSLSKYFISGCELEGFGLVALEALSCNCIPILPNKGAFPEIFFDSRFLYDKDNFDQFTLCEFDETLSKCKNKILDKFTWENSINEYENIYIRVVANNE